MTNIFPIQRASSGVNPLEDLQVLQSGEFFNQGLLGGSYSNGTANKVLKLSPIKRGSNLTIDQIGISINTGVASSTARVGIYSNVDGKPGLLLLETQALDTATSGYKSEDVDFTFQADTVYWVGAIASDATSLRMISASTFVNMGKADGGHTSMLTHYSLTYGAFPSALPENMADYPSMVKTSGNFTAVIMRVA